MKKILIALLASTAVGGVAAAQSFPDVPAGSYAEEAVARLADLGIVIGFPDGTFRGNEAFTRYQAALLATRLLDTVEGEMLTDADLDTVRNALQELASDVAASEQAVSDLQAAIDGAAGADEAAVEALQAELDALTVELDTLTAAGEAAAGLEQQVQSNTDQIGQLSDLIGILNEDLAAIGTGGEEPDTSFLDDIEQNTADIANLREFVVLLRRDQVGVTERVATIEESDTAQNARLDDITARVEALEGASVGFSGSIGLKYDVGRLSGDEIPFDVDRIFGVGQDREQPQTYFSGDFEGATDDLNDDGDSEDDNEVAQDRQDIEFSDGDFAPELTLNVDFSSARGIAPESGLNTFDASVALELSEATVLDADTDVEDPDFDPLDGDNYFSGYVFEFNSFEATLGPIGADPVNFYFGEDPGADFTDYVFESLGSGFRADIGTPDFLAFLQPTLQLAYGTYENGGDSDEDTLELPDNGEDTLAVAPPGTTDVVAPGALAVANPWTDAYYRGLRGTLTPFAGEGFGLTGGFSVAQIAGNADENADAANGGAGDNADITVYGLDGTLNLSILNVTFEYAQNDIGEGVYFQDSNNLLENEAEETAGFDGIAIDEGDGIPVALDGSELDSAVYYAEATLDTAAAGIPLLQSLSANYRSVPEFWYGLKYDEDSYRWETDQEGYGAEATIGLSIFSLTGYVDQYSIEDGEPTDTAFGSDGAEVAVTDIFAYGVRLGAEIFRAVEIFASTTSVEANGGTPIADLEDAERNGEYVAGIGVGVQHDGEAENALIPGLNFSVTYDVLQQQLTAGTADGEFTLAGFTLNPYVDYSVDESPAVGSDDVTALEAGTGILTEPLDIILQPSFAANVNYRNATHTDVEDEANYVADVLQYSVGINFNQFLFENSTIGVRYGSFAGTNVEFDPNINGADDNASDISDGDQPGTGTQVTNGYEIVWNYYGLEFGYGAYFSGNNGDTPAPSATGGQAFSILYTVNF